MADERRQSTRLAPDEAFGARGNEIRVQILRRLGDADDELAVREVSR